MVQLMSLQEQVERDFERARRKAFFGRLKSRLRHGSASDRLPCFDKVRRACRADSLVYLGRREVEVARIVGSVGRCREFDRDFLPITLSVGEKWKRVDLAFYRGEELPPVSLYKIGDEFFVSDGNHRVSVARYQGVEMIDAEVTECRPSNTRQVRSEDVMRSAGRDAVARDASEKA